MSTRRLELLASALILSCGCSQKSDSSHDKVEPAKVAYPGDEKNLNTITLTEQAEERLGIRTAEVRLADLRRRRIVGGVVVIPPGQTIVVSAPLAGTLSAPEGASVPAPGSKLAKGQAVLSFTPLLTPERDVLTPAERVRVAQTRADVATAQIDAERQVESAKVQVEAAQIAYDRAVQLLKTRAGSQRSVDEANAQLKLSREALATAEARNQFLSGIRLDEDPGQLVSRTIESPVAGVLQSIDEAVGETVSTGEPLFHVVQLDRLWIRVPVYVGQWRQIDTGQKVSVAEYGQLPAAPTREARYVSAPPTADANATTVDLYYELANDDGRLYPGQKLAVTLPLESRAQSLVAPWSAILYDIHGGAWVYEKIEAHTYARRRVEVEYVEKPDAILTAGPQPGTKVVTDGAAELFGTEFGAGK